MKTSLDCIPCFLRQAIEAARIVSEDAALHERMVKEVLSWISELDMNRSPPALGQRIHRRLREITGLDDPYSAAKARSNRMAMSLLPEGREMVKSSADSLLAATRLAIAGNVMDMGAGGKITKQKVERSFRSALTKSIHCDKESFRSAVRGARKILYLADNAGEIVFDRLLIEQLSPSRVTLVVRGGPVINDATMEDAIQAGLTEIVEVIDNGSDAPGTLLDDCSPDFKRRFQEADLVIAKGQGNFETLSNLTRNILFLFKVKCEVISSHVGLPIGTHVAGRFESGAIR